MGYQLDLQAFYWHFLTLKDCPGPAPTSELLVSSLGSLEKDYYNFGTALWLSCFFYVSPYVVRQTMNRKFMVA